jgi:hypothetical protein
MGTNLFKTLSQQYPFISLVIHAGNEYIGIVQNTDDTITTIYDFGALQDAQLKRLYLDLANIWWWESNHLVPINIFLRREWEVFRPYLRTFNNKELQIVHGPTTCLAAMARKKSKRKSITLVRKVN